MKNNENLWREPISPQSIIGYVIRRKRLNRGMSVDSLARRSGYCARTISRIEQFYTEKPLHYIVRDIIQTLDELRKI